jgi:hypothetical protein
LASLADQAPKRLYNGIVLPDTWPPRHEAVSYDQPSTPPYLSSPPKVIPIDVGRQLFVDEFLIEATNLRRSFHSAEYYPGRIVLQPDKPWERHGGRGSAMVYSDGVWYDQRERLYKMWYSSGSSGYDGPQESATLYAVSQNGTHWRKPELDVVKGTNIVLRSARDSSTVWVNPDETDAARRYILGYADEDTRAFHLHFSADGIHWGKSVAQSPPDRETNFTMDRTTFFWNPFRAVWVMSIRDDIRLQPTSMPENNFRYRTYREARDIVSALRWESEQPVPWTGADRLDPIRLELNVRSELYNLDAVAYESLLLGLFSIWRGQPENRGKPNDLVIGYSRDGFHWDRPFREPFIPAGDLREWTNIQSAGGGCLVVGDRLFFYMSGRSGTGARGWGGGSGQDSTGLATLRRDGFVSMDAAENEGTLTTRPVLFSGKYLFVNVNAQHGELRAEALDASGKTIAPFTRARCRPVTIDNTLQAMNWEGSEDLASLAGKPVRFRFYLKYGELYSFWVSRDHFGASHGYVAAGGPGFTAPIDTVGSQIYSHCCGFKPPNNGGTFI